VSLETGIIKYFLSDRSIYFKYNKYLLSDSLDYEYKILLKCIEFYYNQYSDKEDISLIELKIVFEREYPHIKNPEAFAEIFSNLRTTDISEQLIVDAIKFYIEKDYLNRIVNVALPVLSGKNQSVLAEIDALSLECQEALGRSSEQGSIFYDKDLQSIINEEINSKGYHWRLSILNEYVGPLRGKRLGHIFAYVDTGKTTFLLSEISNLTSQISDDECIVWFNNEEANSYLKLRLYCSVLNTTIDTINNNINKAQEVFTQRGGDRIKLYDDSSISLSDVECVLKTHKPKIVFIDIGDKIIVPGKYARGDERIKALYVAFRMLTKKYGCDIITLGQADVKAEQIKFLRQSHMDASKVGKPGELDFAVGIGMEQLVQDNMRRYISICKNKRGPYARGVVQIDPARGRYSDI